MNSRDSMPKKQHYVPRFYLNEFATDDTYGLKDKQQVHIYNKKNEKFEKRNTKSIAHKKYLYSPKDDNNNRSSYMEDKLGLLENNISSKIWSDLANDYIDLDNNNSIKKYLALFISTLILRHPNNLNENELFFSKFYKDIIKHFPHNVTECKFIIKDKEFILNIEEVTSRENQSDYDKSMFFIENIELLSIEYVEIFMKKKWSIVTSEERCFITSDNPVIISNDTTNTFGINTKGTIISFPISPNRLLLLEDNINNSSDVLYHPLNKGHHPYFNSPLWGSDNNFIISSNNLEIIVDEIYEYFNKD